METSGGSTGEGETDASCVTHGDCDFWEVCDFDSTCILAEDAAYEVRVPSWNPATCDGGLLDGDADLFWSLSIAGSVRGESSWRQGGCPGSWPDDVACVGPGVMAGGFALSAYDQDNTKAELLDLLWWDDDNDTAPDPIHPSLLHAGVYDGATGNGGLLRVEFTIVQGCDAP